MSAQNALVRGTYTSISPTALTSLDLGDVGLSYLRPPDWWDSELSFNMQGQENDTAFLAYLQNPTGMSIDLTQVLINWRCSRAADLWTTNTFAIAVADQYMRLVDPVLAGVGRGFKFIKYGIEFRILDTDDDLSEGWVNGAGNACNVKFERLTGPLVVIPAGEYGEPGHGILPELGSPAQAFSQTPGDPYWNTFSMVGLYVAMSRLQEATQMATEYGTFSHLTGGLWYQHRMAKQGDLIFSRRYIGPDSQGNGQIYKCDGVLPQIITNVFDAGEDGVNLVWPNLNDWWERTMNTNNSSGSKDHWCDSQQWSAILAQAAGAGMLVEGPMLQDRSANASALGARVFTTRTAGGGTVRVHLLRRALSTPATRNFGFTLDPANVGYGAFRAISELYVNDFLNKEASLTQHGDCLLDTYSTILKDESTCMVIRGGSSGKIG